MRLREARRDLLDASEINRQRRLGAGVAHVDLTPDPDAVGLGALLDQRPRGLHGELVGDLLQLRQRRGLDRPLDGTLAQRALVREAHAVGREHSRVGVQEHRVHAQLVRDEASVLPARAAEAGESEVLRVVAPLDGDLLDRERHVGDGNAQAALGDRARVLLGFARRRCHLAREHGEALAHRVRVERRVAAWAEQRREVRGLDLAHHDVRVRNRERPAAPVAGRPWVRPRAVGPHAEPGAVEVEDGAAARGHGVDRHHRRPHPHPRDLGLEDALERAVVERDVRARAAHVEADDPVQPRASRGSHRADDAAGRPREDRVLAREAARLGEVAAALHEVEPYALQIARDLRHVAPQDGREVSVDDGRVRPRHEAQERADLGARAHLGEALLARDLGAAPLHGRVSPGVYEGDGAGREARLPRLTQHRPRARLVERLHLPAVRAHASRHLRDPLVEHRGQLHIEVEQARPGLVADAQEVGEAPVDEKQRPLAPALQEGVGRDRRAHLHLRHGAGRDAFVRCEAEQVLDAGDRGVPVAAGVLAEQLVRDEPTGWVARHDIGERAAAVDPELPAAALRRDCRAHRPSPDAEARLASSRPRVSGSRRAARITSP